MNKAGTELRVLALVVPPTVREVGDEGELGSYRWQQVRQGWSRGKLLRDKGQKAWSGQDPSPEAHCLLVSKCSRPGRGLKSRRKGGHDRNLSPGRCRMSYWTVRQDTELLRLLEEQEWSGWSPARLSLLWLLLEGLL